MTPDRPAALNRLEEDVREALAAESPVPTPLCPDLTVMLDAIEEVDAGEEPEALAHIAACAFCRREYLALRASFSEADALRSTQPATVTAERPAEAGLLARLGAWLAAPLRRPARQLGLAGAAALAAGLLGYVVGTGTTPEAPPPPVASKPGPDVQARLDRLNAELRVAQAENERLKRLAAQRPTALPTGGLKASQPSPVRAEKPAVRLPRPVAAIPPVVHAVAALGRPVLRIELPPGLIERGAAHVEFLPAGTWVMSDRPVFRCRFPGASADTRYSVRLVTPSGEVLTVLKAGEALRWRPGVRLSGGQQYVWTASARVGDHGYTATGRFSVLTQDEAMRVQAQAARERGLARAQVYRRAGLLPEAAAVLEAIPPSSRDYVAARQALVQVREAMIPRVSRNEAVAPDATVPPKAPEPPTVEPSDQNGLGDTGDAASP